MIRTLLRTLRSAAPLFLATLLVGAAAPARAQVGTPFSCSVDGATAIARCQQASSTLAVAFVTDLVVSNGGTAQSVQLVTGTGTSCGTNQAVLTPKVYLPVNGTAVIPLHIRLAATAAGVDICCKPSGTTAFSCLVAGTVTTTP